MTAERDPERWLQDIEARWSRGDTDAALQELIEEPGRGNPESPHPAQ